jgi:L-lactate dehydrogenase complex protein LldE
VSLLDRLSQPVEFPLAQSCWGQMHANSGYFEVRLVRRYVETFSAYDAVVVPSGSCAGSIHHQYPMIARAAGDEPLARRAEAVASRTHELSQFVIDVLGSRMSVRTFRTGSPTTRRVIRCGCWRVGDRPLRLLRRVRECCGPVNRLVWVMTGYPGVGDCGWRLVVVWLLPRRFL